MSAILPGSLVRIRAGEHAGKIARVYGLQQSFDVIGERGPIYVGVDSEWATHIKRPKREHFTAILRMRDVEAVAEGTLEGTT